MGGEKFLCRLLTVRFRGSPPHGRGKEIVDITEWPTNRITPAWAGKRYVKEVCIVLAQDHPRMGGEKLLISFKQIFCQGSPPHGRGKGIWIMKSWANDRITPAWAGKRCVLYFSHYLTWDHPRMGGEKQVSDLQVRVESGSPPHGRGKVKASAHPAAQQRITPAWAGKRLKRSHRSGIFISGPIPFHSVLHRPAGPGGSRAGRDGSPAGQPQNAGPA